MFWFWLTAFCLREMSVAWVFSAAKVTCHLLPQDAMLCSVWLMRTTVLWWSLLSLVNVRVQSSSYAVAGTSWRRSLKYTFHNNGPSTLPWGMLALTGCSEVCPLTTTRRVLLSSLVIATFSCSVSQLILWSRGYRILISKMTFIKNLSFFYILINN